MSFVCVSTFVPFSNGRFTNIHFTRWPKWQTWKNKNPQSNTIHEHMALHHSKSWCEIIILNKLKGWETIDLPTIRKKNQEPFSLEGFYQQLVHWVSVDDQVCEKSVNYWQYFYHGSQSINVVDCPKLQDLLLFIGAELHEKDIPHCTKLVQLITERFQIEYKQILEELEVRFAFFFLWGGVILKFSKPK